MTDKRIESLEERIAEALSRLVMANRELHRQNCLQDYDRLIKNMAEDIDIYIREDKC